MKSLHKKKHKGQKNMVYFIHMLHTDALLTRCLYFLSSQRYLPKMRSSS